MNHKILFFFSTRCSFLGRGDLRVYSSYFVKTVQQRTDPVYDAKPNISSNFSLLNPKDSSLSLSLVRLNLIQLVVFIFQN